MQKREKRKMKLVKEIIYDNVTRYIFKGKGFTVHGDITIERTNLVKTTSFKVTRNLNQILTAILEDLEKDDIYGLVIDEVIGRDMYPKIRGNKAKGKGNISIIEGKSITKTMFESITVFLNKKTDEESGRTNG